MKTLKRIFIILLVTLAIALTPESFAQEDAQNKVISLQDCIKMAMESHPDLKSSQALRMAAKAKVKEALSDYFPQISFSSSYSHSVSDSDQVLYDSVTNMPYTASRVSNNYNNRLALSQNIFDFGRTSNTVTVARENLKASEYDVLIQVEDIIYSIQEAYFQSIAAKRAVEVGQEAVRLQEIHLKQAQGFYQMGRRSKIEVTKAEVDLANSQLDLLKYQNAEKLARVKLANAIGVTGNFDYKLDDQVKMVEPDLNFEQAINHAQKFRPEILKYEAIKRGSQASLDLARSSYYPTLSGSGYYGYQDDHFALKNKAWGWGVNLNFDIFTGGYRQGRVTEAEYNLKSTKEKAKRLWQDIYLEVQQAFLDLNYARSQIQVLEKSLDNARENFSLAQGRYEVGLSDNLEFNDARLSLQQAKNNLISAILNYQIAQAKLEKSIGLSTETYEIKNNHPY